ncbi:hypothetical protein D3C75_1273780 [compost metagenome]
MLQEKLVDGHLVNGLFGDIRHPSKEAFLMLLAVQLITKITEIHLERWIADNVIEFFKRLTLPMVGVGHGVALDDIGDGVH